MNLLQIPDGSRLVLDANIIIYAANQASQQCLALFERCRTQEVEGFLTTVGVAECCHRWMMSEATKKKLISGGNPAKALASKPQEIKKLSDYAARVSGLLNGTLQIRPVESADFLLALQLQRRWGLMTNDSLLLAVAERLGLSVVATADSCFDSIHGYMVYKPDDLIG